MARYRADGNIEYLGRVDEQVKFLGHRVELGEIRHLLNAHPQVRDSVVVLRADGRGNQLLVAYYVARQELAVNELREVLGQSLLRETIPNLFVHLKKLPLTINGKLNYEGLPAVAAVREKERPRVQEERSPTAEILSGIWAEVLGVKAIGVDDNFFELGGHSLLATQGISRVREAFGIEMQLRGLLEQRSVRGLAGLVDMALRGGAVSRSGGIERVRRAGPLPLSYAQQRLWFLDQLEPGNPFYNIPLAVRLRGELQVEALERSVNEIIRRHEVLRTRFVLVDGEPTQLVLPEVSFKLPVIDFTELNENHREKEAERIAVEESQRSFDLVSGPLLRVRLLRHSSSGHLLLLTLHHIVSDGWSEGLLIRELMTIYDALIRGEEVTLPALPIQYVDYAVWQRRWLHGSVLAEHLSYWRSHLAGAPEVLELPTDNIRPKVPAYQGARFAFEFGTELAQRLRAMCQRESVTPF